ncbi:MAG: undecaprenyl-diphosphatase [Capsulimonas sp.]|nr:undecaprenyl-diphosphatase [Capsulimonas sp.]
MSSITLFCAQYLFVVPIALFLWGWLRADAAGRRALLLRGVIALVLGVALAKGGGALYDDPRPFVVGHFTPMIAHAPDNGFPSDHSLLVFSCAFLLWPFDRRLSALAAIASAAVGAARVASGLHHPFDVFASILFAGVGCALGAALARSIPLKFTKNESDLRKAASIEE